MYLPLSSMCLYKKVECKYVTVCVHVYISTIESQVQDYMCVCVYQSTGRDSSLLVSLSAH